MEWTAGEILKAGKQNVINAPLVDQKNVVFTQLQNLGLIKDIIVMES